MYDIADRVTGWLADGRHPTVAILVATRGLSSAEPGAALAWTGDETVGGLVALAALVRDAADRAAPGLVEVTIGDEAAAGAGLACGGVLTLLVRPAAGLPDGTWDRLVDREPLCLVAASAAVELFTPTTIRAATSFGGAVPRLFGRGVTAAMTADGGAVVAYWPVPSLLVVGDGLIAAALCAQAGLLGWSAAAVDDVGAAVAAVGVLRHSDALVVLSHDRDVDGPVLAAALSGTAGYVGALGSRRTQAVRRGWLIARGVDETALERIHGPAGLDLDAHTPAEIAVSIVAEILAARAGSSAASLRDRPGPVHVAGVQAPPPRY